VNGLVASLAMVLGYLIGSVSSSHPVARRAYAGVAWSAIATPGTDDRVTDWIEVRETP
jgi:glycerol-3-phosphate acyltransferase PlsY